LFEIKDNKLTITASDSETRMMTSIAVDEVEREGTYAVPSKNLLDALKELPEQPITFAINEENLEMFIYYENGKYNFVAQKGDEYPQSKPLNDNAATLSLKASDLLAGITHTIFASGEDELRPVMNGVFFDISPENITFVASDGHKLVRSKNLSVTGNDAASFILPKKPANLLKNILPREEGNVEIGFDVNNAYITMAHFSVVCRLIEGRYPNYSGVIPLNNPYKVTVDRVNFVNALKRVTVFADPGTSLIRLSFSHNSIFISAQDINFSTSAEETILCNYDGTNMNIGFKGIYLIEILNNILSEEVELQLADPSRAGLILPAENEEGQDLLMLLMPMMLNE
jgi:DNA polymerase-3 subunit beta